MLNRVITVYQAYSPEISLPAVREGRFLATNSRSTPSNCWMKRSVCS
ncbi:DUF4291 family protein [Streptomyces sp. NPDC007095]